MKNIEVGLKLCISQKIDETMFAVNVGSGNLEVLATPVMTMLMEKAAYKCVEACMENDETTVGTELNIKHVSATPDGMNVNVEAEVIEVNGREITFKVTAYDEAGLIGEGTHKRFVVYSEKFMSKVQSKVKQ